MNIKKTIIFLTFSLHAPSVFAYLDPGSGSALVGFFSTMIGSLWFALVTVYYRLKSPSSHADNFEIDDKSIVLFSEGGAYWGTFRPLVSELLKQKIVFRYFTLDFNDPALKIDSQYMKSKRLSLNSLNLSQINTLRANCLIATTPNIGVPNYPIKKSPYVGLLIHIFHHLGDISIYKKNSLDYYDYVILGGDFQKKAIRQLENKRKLKKKPLVPLGLLYLDDLDKSAIYMDGYRTRRRKKTILIGSSWGEKGCLRHFGTDFISKLANAGFDIIIRPHPQSLKTEPEFLNKCRKELNSHDIRWDMKIDPSQSMHESDILISDTSSLRFDYACLYSKPVITLNIPKENLLAYERADLIESWYETASYQIGPVIGHESMFRIDLVVAEILDTYQALDHPVFKKEIVQNFGNCASAIVNHLVQLNTRGLQ